MAPLSDPIRLEAYKDALSNWQYDGFIRFELTETAQLWVRDTLGIGPLKEIGRLMHEYVESGGEIDEVPETRPEWDEYEYHYDLRLKVNNVSVYVESRLEYREPLVADESSILVVNIHAP